MEATPHALEELKKTLKNDGNPTTGVRIFTQQGCCGPALQMSVVDEPSADDLQLSIDSVNFFIEKPAVDLLAGVTLDYGTNGFKLEGLKRNGGGCCS